MSTQSDKKNDLYRSKDIVIVLCGIPVVATFAVFCASFVTSYAGL